MGGVIFWDVDTQYDFMRADGKLYVPDAEQIIPNLRRLTAYARAKRIRVIASADDHVPGHRELSRTPDFKRTFPEHCMRGTKGQARIPETRLEEPLVIEPGREFKPVAKNSIESYVERDYPTNPQETVYSNPVFEGGSMYVRAEGHLYRIETKKLTAVIR